ncbi:MAG: RHS repeat-associated core domain-containing protein [Pelagimonas sp.]|nr:RHS repeat-associated core domain-containing protein [Pelagimonas sp.]
MASYGYDGYGQITQATSALQQRYGYTGREFDRESRLYHSRARAFDPASGKFLQSDPIGFSSGTLNIYGYVSGNTYNREDPTGLSETLQGITLTSSGIGHLIQTTAILSAAALVVAASNTAGTLDGLSDHIVQAQGAIGSEERSEYCIDILNAKHSAAAVMRRACYNTNRSKAGRQNCYRQEEVAKQRAWREYYECLEEDED